MQNQSFVFNGRLKFILVGLISLFTFATASSAIAAPNSVDFSFGSKVVDGFSIGKSLVQPDGKVLIAGGFDVIVSQPTAYMIRLNTDGTRDSTFQSAAPGSIDDFVLQPDGKIVVAGRFYWGFSTCYSFNQCYGIMRLNANGSVDSTFTSGISPNGSEFVNTVVMQADGKFIIGGSFNTYGFGGPPRGSVARINADGSLDPTFQDPNVVNGSNHGVNALVLQPDGKVLIGGVFDTVSGQTRVSIARLNADGTLDAGFQGPTLTGTFTTVATIAVQPDNKVLIGGSFRQVGGQNRSVARLNVDGTLDASFQAPNYSSYIVSKILLQADGKILLDGAFPSVPGNSSVTKARLNSNGVIDSTFNLNSIVNLYGVTLQSNGRLLVIGTFAAPVNNDTSVDYFIVREISLDGAANAIAVQADGKILIGGIFSSATGQPRKGVARLNANGTLDASFPNLNIVFTGDASITGIRKIVVQPNGKIVIIGSFSTVAGQTKTNIAQLNADGTLDASFQNPTITYAFNGYIADVVLQTDGKILLGGGFSAINNQPHNSIVRLNTDGTLDATLQNGLPDNFGVRTLAAQTDGKIILGGNFPIAFQVRRAIARLNADGTLDGTLQNTAVSETGTNDGGVNVVRIQTDGKILIGGLFSFVGGQARKFLARINADGTLDTTFQNPAFTGSNGVYAMALQTDGKILVSGDFFTAGGQGRNGLARINADGSVDTTFGNDNVRVNPFSNALTLQRDGKILIGGDFSLVANRDQRFISRLLGTPISFPASISGRVLTSDGRGLRNATVSMTDSNGVRRTATTSSFGFFSFGEVATGGQYTFRVASRLFRYNPQMIQVTDDLTLPDFIGLE